MNDRSKKTSALVTFGKLVLGAVAIGGAGAIAWRNRETIVRTTAPATSWLGKQVEKGLGMLFGPSPAPDTSRP